MNDKDKEAFDKWWISNKYQLTSFYWHDTSLVGSEILATWKAACEYKKETLLECIHNYYSLMEELKEWKEAARSEAEEVNRLQAENKKLREALEYLNTITVLPEKVKPIIREALKEIKE